MLGDYSAAVKVSSLVVSTGMPQNASQQKLSSSQKPQSNQSLKVGGIRSRSTSPSVKRKHEGEDSDGFKKQGRMR